ncbi:hypothetical protein ACSA002_1060 [Salmonella phage vB_SalM_SA002]|nr:hypothetical protein ACSA002_1060 [Salmonella phage vB_SalM_SA002]
MIESLLYSGARPIATGQLTYSMSGNFIFTVPNNVTELCVYAQAGGGGGGYGNTSYRGLAGTPGSIGKNGYLNAIPVTPGETLTVTIGSGGNTPGPGSATTLSRGGTVLLTVAGGAAGSNATSTGLSERNPGYPGPAAPAVPGATGLGTGNLAPGSGGNGGKGYGFGGGYTASKGIAGAMRIIWGKNRAFPSTNVADMKVV